jgi:hypothetical protein
MHWQQTEYLPHHLTQPLTTLPIPYYLLAHYLPLGPLCCSALPPAPVRACPCPRPVPPACFACLALGCTPITGPGPQRGHPRVTCTPRLTGSSARRSSFAARYTRWCPCHISEITDVPGGEGCHPHGRHRDDPERGRAGWTAARVMLFFRPLSRECHDDASTRWLLPPHRWAMRPFGAR